MRVKKITELARISVDEFKQTGKIPLTVVLDNVRSLNNIGSVFRTADAFLIESICLCGITAQPPHAEIHKTALGAEDSVDWRYYPDTLHALDELKKQGYIICAIEQATGSIPLDTLDVDKSRKYAVILGNEVKGVEQPVVDACDCCIEIPQFGTKHSLNVSIAGGLVLWEFFKKLR
ncbi:RNA methyltransferase [Dysgonomonas sp. 25]|uniref:RNA methyltransferase n=1 Tax=Dysgonomonas sp. 25 TaxID=2302933 RepID=UPI0013D012F9|nr:RNA methyltransferase [Dysgonomonas sp. 25]NDV68082.1 TrmH family RNA methyltransferase [Dysgonomonas sp. 25]